MGKSSQQSWLINTMWNLQYHCAFCIIQCTRLIVLFICFIFSTLHFTQVDFFFVGHQGCGTMHPKVIFPLLFISILSTTLPHAYSWLLFILPLPVAWILFKIISSLFLFFTAAFTCPATGCLLFTNGRWNWQNCTGFIVLLPTVQCCPGIIFPFFMHFPQEKVECHRVTPHRLIDFSCFTDLTISIFYHNIFCIDGGVQYRLIILKLWQSHLNLQDLNCSKWWLLPFYRLIVVFSSLHRLIVVFSTALVKMTCCSLFFNFTSWNLASENLNCHSTNGRCWTKWGSFFTG